MHLAERLQPIMFSDAKGTPLYRIRQQGYRCEEPTETPCEYLFHTQGCYDETLVNISKPLIHFNRLTWPIGHRITIEISSFVAV